MIRVRPWHKTLLAGLAYALIVGLMTWPVLRDLDQRLIGKSIDTWIFYWNNWWLGQALTGDWTLFQTPFLFFPLGTDLVAHSFSYLNSFLASLYEPLAGPVAAYNLVALTGLWLSALGMFLFVKEITGRYLAAFIAGFVFAFAPYHITQLLAHDHLSAIHWWPFFALFLHRTLHDDRILNAVAAGLFAALSVWSGLQLGILLALWALSYISWFLWQNRANAFGPSREIGRTAGRLGIATLATLLLCAPLLWALVDNWSTVIEGASGYAEGLQKQTDLLAYLVPPDVHPLWADRFMPLLEQFGYSKGYTPYVGFAVLALSLVAVLGWRKQAYFWSISAGLWILLAAGSAARFNGQVYDDLWLPFRWLGTLFPISVLRAPDRFNLLVVFSLAVLVGLAAAYLEGRRLWRWALLPLGLLIVLEYALVPFPMKDMPAWSPFLEQMAEDDASYAVVDYPLGYDDSKRWLIYQTWHGKPMVEGHVSRYGGDTYAYVGSQPLLNALYQGATLPPYLPGDFFKDQAAPVHLGPELRDLLAAGVRYILLHRPYTDQSRLAHFDSLLPLIPVHEDDALTVYDVQEPWSRRFGRPPVELSPGIELLQATARLDPDDPALHVRLITQMTNQVDRPPECHLLFPGSSDGASGIVAFTPLPRSPEWLAGDLADQTLRLPLPSEFESGATAWQVNCLEGMSISSPDRLYQDDGKPVLLNEAVRLQYEASIDLTGYRWWIQQSDLHLALHWHALEDVERDYRYFVHLLDEEGQIVRQYDGLHCNWLCPSSSWSAGQRIVEETTLSLWGLPDGEYRLAIGLYDAETGQRLAVRGGAGNAIPEAYFILDGAILIGDHQ